MLINHKIAFVYIKIDLLMSQHIANGFALKVIQFIYRLQLVFENRFYGLEKHFEQKNIIALDYK